MELTEQHYLFHLTKLNAHNKVILAEDMFNHKGVLVVNKGAEVTPDFARKVAQHKLVKPLETCISLTSPLSYQKIVSIYSQHLRDLNIIEVFKGTSRFNQVITAFNALSKYPLIIQKLSVLENRMPKVLAKCLITSGFCIGMCQELELSKESTEHVFIANMMSEIGLLHIDPNVVAKKEQYTPEEWKLMQGHVAIAKNFADQVPNLPKRISRALLEHHERIDGFGYPFGKKGDQLCIEGQILSMVDMAAALVNKLVVNGSYSWKAVIDVMQVPSTAIDKNLQKAAMRVLKRVPFPSKLAFPESSYKKLAQQCVSKHKRLNLWFKEFSQIYVDHENIMVDSEEFKPFDLLKQLQYTLDMTGFVSESQDIWLVNLPDVMTTEDCIEVEEFSLILNEIEYQCFFILRQFRSVSDKLAERFGNAELPILYYEGLNNILTSK